MKRGLVLVLILVMLSSSVLSLSFVSPSYCDIEGTVTSIDFNEAGCHEDEIWEELSGCWENYYRLHLNVTKSVGISDKVVENKYADITCEERLGEDSDISEMDDADYELMSARLMGRDVSVILNPEAKKYIMKMLEAETGEQKSYKFIEDMRQGDYIHRDDFDERLKLLEAFQKGFIERF